MSSPLEKFIAENREKFDTELPDPRIWEKLNEKMNPETKNVTRFPSKALKRWLAVAASVLLVALTGILYYSLHKSGSESVVAKKTTELPGNSSNTNNLPAATPTVDSSAIIAKVPLNNKNQNEQPAITTDSSETKSDIGENKEMYYYTKLIELKHEELKTLEKDEPLLYRQFSSDVQRLDSVYHSLKTQLPRNSNREQVIEAMISNLQLQIGLLNKQLDIIKKIKHFKKTAYEKAYKSV
jgi:hypothetical protein